MCIYRTLLMSTSKLTYLLFLLTSVFSEIVSEDAEIVTRYSRILVAPLQWEAIVVFHNA